MLGKERVLEIAETALRGVEADQAEVLVWTERSALTRFAESQIHQNMAETNLRLMVAAITDKQIGCASTNLADADSLAQVARQASLLARNSAANPEFQSLPAPQPIDAVAAFSETTAASTPEDRADAVEKMIGAAKQVGAIASGSYAVGEGEFAIASSLGVRAYQPTTNSRVVIVVADGDASGYGEWNGKDIATFDPIAVAAKAAKDCAASRGAQAIAPGQYTVVLEESAVAEIIMYMGWIGFSALAYQEGRSFMCDKLGQKIVADSISIWDDGHDPRILSMAFDFEGVPKQKVMLIENGVAKGVVYDTLTAQREGKKSTGHATPINGGFNPYAMNICMNGGDATLEQMIASTERGLLVRRFHYMNIITPRDATLTGMTRDGTFLIENGKVTRPVQKLRYTESAIRALSNVEMLGKDLWLSEGPLVPAMKIKDFTFTS
jgi:PmbA protein